MATLNNITSNPTTSDHQAIVESLLSEPIEFMSPTATFSETITESGGDAEISEPLTEFQLFPKLPIELRIKIWKFVPEPRMVEVNFLKEPVEGQEQVDEEYVEGTPKWCFVADIPVCALYEYNLVRPLLILTRSFFTLTENLDMRDSGCTKPRSQTH